MADDLEKAILITFNHATVQDASLKVRLHSPPSHLLLLVVHTKAPTLAPLIAPIFFGHRHGQRSF